MFIIPAGYGDSSSVLNVTLTEEDEGSTIRCLIDVGGIDSAADRAILVSLGIPTYLLT